MSQILQFNLTLDASIQPLSDVLALADGQVEPSFRELQLQADDGNTNPIFIGDSEVSATVFASFIPLPPANIPGAPLRLGPYEAGPLKLSEIFAVGTDSEVLNILGVTF